MPDIRRLTLRQIHGLYVEGQKDRKPEVKEPETEQEVYARMLAFGKAMKLPDDVADRNACQAVLDWRKERENGKSATDVEPSGGQ